MYKHLSCGLNNIFENNIAKKNDNAYSGLGGAIIILGAENEKNFIKSMII